MTRKMRAGLHPWTWRQHWNWKNLSSRRSKRETQHRLTPIIFRKSNNASKNSEDRRRLKSLRQRSELISSNSSKRNLNDHLSLAWCPPKAFPVCRWWIHTCNISSRLLSTSRIHLPRTCKACLEACSVATCSATWCKASSNRSRFSNRSHSRALNWASLNLLSSKWANRWACKASKQQRRKVWDPKPSRVKKFCLRREAEAMPARTTTSSQTKTNQSELPLPHRAPTSPQSSHFPTCMNLSL